MKTLLTLLYFLIWPLQFVRADVLTLTSLEWPPYTSPNLTHQGATTMVVKAAVEVMGHELNVELYPWQRSVMLAKTQPKYAGYFPEYYFESEDVIFSQSIGSGPLGFAEHTSTPITWSSLQDLKTVKLGVINGYVNTQKLDDMIANGDIEVEAVVRDSQNLHKLAKKRISLAVIDSNVFSYLLSTDSTLRQQKGRLQMNPKILADKQLFIAFLNDEEGKKWKKVVDEGLNKIDVDKIMSTYFSSIEQPK